jgi:hypothetical protein
MQFQLIAPVIRKETNTEMRSTIDWFVGLFGKVITGFISPHLRRFPNGANAPNRLMIQI